MQSKTRIYQQLKRLIKPQVRDRVVVKVVNAGDRKRLKPAFIIGVFRSGTTLLRYVLDSHSQIAVPPESIFLRPLSELWSSEWVRNGLRGSGVDNEALLERLRDFAWPVFDDYATAKGKSRWVDKTPAYVDILGFLDLLFSGECRYIMLYRHGLDVANSLFNFYPDSNNRGPVTKFIQDPEESLRISCARYWAAQTEKMIAFEASHPRQCFRLRYEDYVTEPEKYLPPVFEFLGEDWEPDTLHFNDKRHDFGLQDNNILSSQGFTPQLGKYRAWDQADQIAATQVAEGTLRKLGYEIPDSR